MTQREAGDEQVEWHQLTADAALSRVASHRDGLSASEVQARLARYGQNALIEHGGKSPLAILRDQFVSVMVFLLVGAGIVSVVLGEHTDAIVILAIVILNAVLGFFQEYRAERAIQALKSLAVPTVRIRRGGHVVELSARELVPGDIVMLEAGSHVPADGRLLDAANLRIQESTLTGESEPVEKTCEPLPEGDRALGDRRNMAYMGTAVVAGRGAMVVTSTGMTTELGRIADMLQGVEREPTPLQRRMAQLSRGLLLAVIVLVVIVFVLGLLQHKADIRVLVLTAISMAVAAVPEALPAVVTIALALGAQRMLRRRALMRKLPAVETLGSVDVICSDKTGTLTENRMTVTVLDVLGHRLEVTPDTTHVDVEKAGAPVTAIELLLVGGALCNDAALEIGEDGRHRAIGDPTEGALVVAASRFGFSKPELEQALSRVAEVPFSSERKRMTTVHELDANKGGRAGQVLAAVVGDSRYAAIMKGAVDVILSDAVGVLAGDSVTPMGPEVRGRVEAANDRLALSGMRVLGLAVRPLAELPATVDEATAERGMVFVGMVAMIDPARAEVKDAVATCRAAGVRPVMITGDHPLTARYIASELDMAGTDTEVLTGVDLSRTSAEELQSTVERTSVYARVAPEHKLAIVEALQKKGHIVAMTGDGVNDAPALRRADIGVAMGITGTDVSKEAADMVLLDDNFATIVAAVEEGRVIYDNIRKFLKYTLTSNAGEIWVMLLAPFLGMPMALLPVQILWVNLVTDGLPGLALTVEPAERNTMRRRPYHPSQNIFGRGLAIDVVWVGLMMGLTSLAVGYVSWLVNHQGHWQTMIFTTLTMGQMGNALATRSECDSLFSRGRKVNYLLYATVVLTLGLQLAVTYVPFLQRVFYTVALTPLELLFSLAVSTAVFWSVELVKLAARVRGSRRSRQS
ncbi:cation-translocating P-type ATPase [candidate division WOR-3 bacterium]|uniref:Cation-translocating P-type ATPase n=1 Tax=candidate division WOR-3 bacterium TaxID=2052148 RepID=A0A938BQH7_UNCW3|nr:cation-translocating P-type ATPase [candidate division WOR-3 bacterium]